MLDILPSPERVWNSGFVSTRLEKIRVLAGRRTLSQAKVVTAR